MHLENWEVAAVFLVVQQCTKASKHLGVEWAIGCDERFTRYLHMQCPSGPHSRICTFYFADTKLQRDF